MLTELMLLASFIFKTSSIIQEINYINLITQSVKQKAHGIALPERVLPTQFN